MAKKKKKRKRNTSLLLLRFYAPLWLAARVVIRAACWSKREPEKKGAFRVFRRHGFRRFCIHPFSLLCWRLDVFFGGFSCRCGCSADENGQMHTVKVSGVVHTFMSEHVRTPWVFVLTPTHALHFQTKLYEIPTRCFLFFNVAVRFGAVFLEPHRTVRFCKLETAPFDSHKN